jgi:hypothetical protein
VLAVARCHWVIAHRLPFAVASAGATTTLESDPVTADDRRLLELLAASEDGCTDDLLLAHGFKLDVLISIVSAEFATATPERTIASGRPVKTTRVRITEAGRRTLADREG